MANTSRRIWLTGADTRIGHTLASELLAAGHRLALTAPAQAVLLPFAERYPAQTLLLTGDIRDAEQLKTMADHIDFEWGALDMAILDLGSAQTDHAAEMLSISLYVQEALNLLRRGQDAHVVGIVDSTSPKPFLKPLFDALRADLADEPVEIHVAQVCRPDACPAAIEQSVRLADEEYAGVTPPSPRRKPVGIGPGVVQEILASQLRWVFDRSAHQLHPSKKDR